MTDHLVLACLLTASVVKCSEVHWYSARRGAPSSCDDATPDKMAMTAQAMVIIRCIRLAGEARDVKSSTTCAFCVVWGTNAAHVQLPTAYEIRAPHQSATWADLGACTFEDVPIAVGRGIAPCVSLPLQAQDQASWSFPCTPPVSHEQQEVMWASIYLYTCTIPCQHG